MKKRPAGAGPTIPAGRWRVQRETQLGWLASVLASAARCKGVSTPEASRVETGSGDAETHQPPGGRVCSRPAGRRGRWHSRPCERVSDASERERVPSGGWREVAEAMGAEEGQRHE